MSTCPKCGWFSSDQTCPKCRRNGLESDRFRFTSIPNGISGPYCQTCNECGAMVVDQVVHDTWHDSITATGQTGSDSRDTGSQGAQS